MKQNKRKFWDSIYFRLICVTAFVITIINIPLTFLVRNTELMEAERLIQTHIISQAQNLVSLKLDFGSEYMKYIKYLGNDQMDILVHGISDFAENEQIATNLVLYDDRIDVYRIIIVKTEMPMNLYGILFIDDKYFSIQPTIDYMIIADVTQRIGRFTDTILFACISTLVIMMTYVSKKIKRVTKAAKLVSEGSFDVELSEKGKDEISELAKAFNYMVKELKKNEELQVDFISSVSHEFKTPATSLKGYATLAKSSDLPEEQRQEYLDIIINESNRLSKLCSNLMRISELNNYSISNHYKWFSLDEQIRNIIIVLQTQWEEKKLEFDIDLDVVSFYGDEWMLWHLWNNLIVNGIRYSKPEGIIQISLKILPQGVLFEIQDNGIGIPEHEKDKIFEQFYTVDKSRNHKGNGLGLAIVKKIVNLCEGEIWIESEVDKGSSFFVFFDTKYVS